MSKKEIKVLFVLNWFLYYSVQLANELSDNGCEVHVIGREGLKEINGESTEVFLKKHLKDGIRVFPYAARPANPLDLLTAIGLFRRVRTIKPDIIHIHENYDFRVGFLLILVKLFLRRTKVFLTVHDVDVHVGESRSILKRGFRVFIMSISDKIICHGKELKRQLLAKKVKEDKIIIIYHGALTIYRKFIRREIAEEKNTVLFFGRIYKYKGLEYLIKAEPYIKKEIPDIKIIIAGRGDDLDGHRKEIEGNKSFVLYDQFIPDEMVAELFQRACVVTLPYIEGTQSGVVCLAYAFGKPAVVTNVGSIPETVEDGVTGFVVPPKDHVRLAGAVIDILKNDDQRRSMAEKIVEKTKTDLSWRHIARQTRQAYQQTL